MFTLIWQGLMGVKSYQVLVGCMIACICMGGFSHARTTFDTQTITQRIMSQSQGQDNDYLNRVYYSLKNEQQGHQHPMVRARLGKVTGWMEDHFSSTRLSWTNYVSPSWKSGEKNFITKTGQKFVVAQKEPIVTKTSSVKKTILKTPSKKQSTTKHTRSTVSTVSSQEEPVVTLPAIATKETSREETQRYTLKNTRINISQLTKTWLGWVNDFREQEGVAGNVVHQPLLDKTATQRSLKMRADGDRSHKRTLSSSYYDYNEITQWFADRGLTFANVNRATYTENVGLSTLRGCSEGDCTTEAEQSLRGVFDYFINEKGQAYDAHYKTIIQPYFREMGFGIAIDETTGVIYSTMHYATETKRK